VSDNREFYKTLDTDGLAQVVYDLKEQAGELRQTIWAAEDELRDRLAANEASVLLGKRYRVKCSVKRETIWDQGMLSAAGLVAITQGAGELFGKAFPTKYDCSVRNLNALMKLGGATAKAIEAARAEVREKIEVKVEELK